MLSGRASTRPIFVVCRWQSCPYGKPIDGLGNGSSGTSKVVIMSCYF
ncbi:hypothetical protein AO372_1613 [Moraxella catarrhalis]|nr:hypothetical protein AO372_1613 [Moraxella catarrhalis]